MKTFILNLISRKGLSHFWLDFSSTVVIRPPPPKSLVITRRGDKLTISETHVSLFGWLTSPSPDDVEMQFQIDESSSWIPLYLKIGAHPACLSFESEDGAISYKPVVTKRQLAFAAKWARELEIRGMLRGIVDEQSLDFEL